MNIASIGYTDTGGAGISSLKLHNAFIKAGEQSRFYVSEKDSNNKNVVKLRLSANTKKLSRLQTSQKYQHSTFSTGMGGATKPCIDEICEWADIILLRWIGGALSDLDISTLSQSKKIFWTLSDMAPFTGGCHYAPMECTQYQESCSKCPLFENGMATPKIILDRRKTLWKQQNIHLISPSHWLAETAKKSVVTKNSKISVIPTGVETDIFKYNDNSRRSLNISPSDDVVLFIADSVNDPRKGGDMLLKLITEIEAFAKRKIVFLTVGRNQPPKHSSIKHLGSLREKKELVLAYSAADCTLLPYRQDNLPNTLLESLCCGTPVVCFATSGMTEKIIDGFNGLLSKPFDSRELSEYTVNALTKNKFNRMEIMNHAHRTCSIEEQARKYLNLFNKSIAQDSKMHFFPGKQP